LDSATIQEKRDVLDMLAIKVTVPPEAFEIEGAVPLETTPFESELTVL